MNSASMPSRAAKNRFSASTSGPMSLVAPPVALAADEALDEGGQRSDVGDA